MALPLHQTDREQNSTPWKRHSQSEMIVGMSRPTRGAASLAGFLLQSVIFQMSIKRDCEMTAFPLRDVMPQKKVSIQGAQQRMFSMLAGFFCIATTALAAVELSPPFLH